MKFSFTKNLESEFSYKESKSNQKHSGISRVSDCFFQKNPSMKKKSVFFFFFFFFFFY